MTASPSRGASRATRRTRNSRPTKNITSTTPISARARIVAGSEIRPRAISGPTATPAARYPGTSGSLNRWNTTVTSAATLRMIARSRRKWVAAASVTPERKADQGSRARTTDPSSGIRSGRPEIDRASAASGGWSVRRQSLARSQTSTTPSTARRRDHLERLESPLGKGPWAAQPQPSRARCAGPAPPSRRQPAAP